MSKNLMFDRCTLKIVHLLADVVCIFVFFSNPHVSNMVLVMMMMTGRPLPSPFTYRCVWQLANPPQLVTSLEFVGPRFGPILSGQSHIQILTSHCEIYNSPSAEVR